MTMKSAGVSQSKQPPLLAEDLFGLRDFRLYKESAPSCFAAQVHEILENWEDFADACSLKPLERRRLSAAQGKVIEPSGFRTKPDELQCKKGLTPACPHPQMRGDFWRRKRNKKLSLPRSLPVLSCRGLVGTCTAVEVHLFPSC